MSIEESGPLEEPESCSCPDCGCNCQEDDCGSSWKEEDSNIIQFAKTELALCGYSYEELKEEMNLKMYNNILDLLRVFAKQGHSGFSASYCTEMFYKLAKMEPIGPLTGKDEEWNDVSNHFGGEEKLWQNKRCSHVFKGEDGRAYDMDGKVFQEPNGARYTNKNSLVYIDFPYTPTTEYIDVPEEENE